MRRPETRKEIALRRSSVRSRSAPPISINKLADVKASAFVFFAVLTATGGHKVCGHDGEEAAQFGTIVRAPSATSVIATRHSSSL